MSLEKKMLLCITLSLFFVSLPKSCWSRVTINTTRHGQNFAKYLRYLLRLTTTRYRLAVGALLGNVASVGQGKREWVEIRKFCEKPTSWWDTHWRHQISNIEIRMQQCTARVVQGSSHSPTRQLKLSNLVMQIMSCDYRSDTSCQPLELERGLTFSIYHNSKFINHCSTARIQNSHCAAQ